MISQITRFFEYHVLPGPEIANVRVNRKDLFLDNRTYNRAQKQQSFGHSKTGVTVGGQRLGLECEDPTITEHFLFQQDILKFMLRIKNNPMNISYVFTIAQQLYSEISFLISIFKPIY